MPGCLGLDAMWQLVGYWLGWSGSPGKGRAVGVGEVRFRGDVTPDRASVRYEVDMRQVRRGKLSVGVANGRMLADGACIYTRRRSESWDDRLARAAARRPVLTTIAPFAVTVLTLARSPV